MDILEPEPDVIRQHLSLIHIFPDSFFEIRCLLSTSMSKLFAQSEITEAVEYCVRMNTCGFNIYTVVNPINDILTHEDGTKRDANDKDVCCSTWHWIDVDKLEAADRLEQNLIDCGHEPAIIVVTGITPSPRLHVYWKLDQPTSDMMNWRDVQRRLAQHFKSDRAVSNPARVMRVAGTISYPDQKKIDRGYVEEMVTMLVSDHQVSHEAFVFPALEKAYNPIDDVESTGVTDDGAVPLAVLEAAFAVIPVEDDRQSWLDFGFATKGANHNGFVAWDTWSKQSMKYDAADQVRTWNSLISLPKMQTLIFAAAKNHNSNWWRDDGDVEEWFVNRAKVFSGDHTKTPLERLNAKLRRRFKRISK